MSAFLDGLPALGDRGVPVLLTAVCPALPCLKLYCVNDASAVEEGNNLIDWGGSDWSVGPWNPNWERDGEKEARRKLAVGRKTGGWRTDGNNMGTDEKRWKKEMRSEDGISHFIISEVGVFWDHKVQAVSLGWVFVVKCRRESLGMKKS